MGLSVLSCSYQSFVYLLWCKSFAHIKIVICLFTEFKDFIIYSGFYMCYCCLLLYPLRKGGSLYSLSISIYWCGRCFLTEKSTFILTMCHVDWGPQERAGIQKVRSLGLFFLYILSYFKVFNVIPNYESILIEKVSLALQIFLLIQDESTSFVRICASGFQLWIDFESPGEPYT